MQDSTTANLIFGIPELVSFTSRNMTLMPGDLIMTGTPPGVGFTRKPPVFVKPGDKMEVEIEKIGTLVNQLAGS
jgi:2-keto-4-pentenoate hydratase/2-oxohepta-3-ene-1,7-dioic acid hydratase in catechol pathway